MGTWKELRDQLTCQPLNVQPSIREFLEIYLDYCRTKNTRLDFKVQALASSKRILDLLILLCPGRDSNPHEGTLTGF